MGTMTYVSGATTLRADYTVSSPVTYPFPVVSYSTLAHTGDTLKQALGRLTTASIVDFAGQAVQWPDFAMAAWNTSASNNGGWGLYFPNVAGFLNADMSMTPNSSTKAALINALPVNSTNNYNEIRLSTANSSGTTPAFFSGKLTGTPEGSDYAGLQFYQTLGAVVGPAKIKGIPGSASAPPGETTAIGLYQAKNTTFNDVEVDGTDSTGKRVTATGIGTSGVTGGYTTHNRTYSHGAAYGHGVTHYTTKTHTLTFNQSKFTNNASAGINFERCDGSTAVFNNCTFGSNAVDIIADSDTGFVAITVNDPVFLNGQTKLNVCVHNYYPSSPTSNKQIDSASKNHVTVTVGGVSRPDLINFVSNYTPQTP